MRWLLAALLLGASALMVLTVLPSRAAVSAAPLAQATATSTLTPTVTPSPTVTPTPTPAPASGWEVVDHAGNVRCYWNTLNGQPFGGCVVVTP